MANDQKNPFSQLAQQIKEKQKAKGPVRPQQKNALPLPANRNLPAPPKPTPLAKTPAKPTPVAAPPLPERKPPVSPVGRGVVPQTTKHPPVPQVSGETPAPAPDEAIEVNQTSPTQAALSVDQLYAMAKMGYTQWEYGKLDRARAIFQTLVSQRPNEPWFRCALGSIYQKQRQFAQAIQQYNIALQLDPQDLPSRVNRGEILLKVGKRQEGVSDLQFALKADQSGKHPSALRAKSLLIALKRPGGNLA